jgi:hypothetical protein
MIYYLLDVKQYSTNIIIFKLVQNDNLTYIRLMYTLTKIKFHPLFHLYHFKPVNRVKLDTISCKFYFKFSQTTKSAILEVFNGSEEFVVLRMAMHS